METSQCLIFSNPDEVEIEINHFGAVVEVHIDRKTMLRIDGLWQNRLKITDRRKSRLIDPLYETCLRLKINSIYQREDVDKDEASQEELQKLFEELKETVSASESHEWLTNHREQLSIITDEFLK